MIVIINKWIYANESRVYCVEFDAKSAIQSDSFFVVVVSVAVFFFLSLGAPHNSLVKQKKNAANSDRI